MFDGRKNGNVAKHGMLIQKLMKIFPSLKKKK